MGIDFSLAEPLIKLLPSGHGRKKMLSLGRQSIVIRPGQYTRLNQLLSEQGHGFTFESVLQPDGYSERLLTSLGIEQSDSIDVNDYESATYIADLGSDMGDMLTNEYEVILDGGTTEHVFDVACCLRNIDRMLKKDGVFLSAVPLNGWAEHGFYQFGPEIVYGFWQNTMGYEVLNCEAVSLAKPWKKKTLADHTGLAKRQPLGQGTLPDGRCALVYSVRKLSETRAASRPIQSFYEKTWDRVKARKAAKQTG